MTWVEPKTCLNSHKTKMTAEERKNPDSSGPQWLSSVTSQTISCHLVLHRCLLNFSVTIFEFRSEKTFPCCKNTAGKQICQGMERLAQRIR